MIKTGHLPYNMKHTQVTRADFANAGSASGPCIPSKWTTDQIDAYFKEKYPNLKPPTNSNGKKQTKPVSGFVGQRGKQKGEKGGKGA